ncbi:hypothetical protein [Evtepia sp.]|uniref:hypothetical protein n=1 Tax=Evtepia sp. TaxID=2773933 RepID=UPI002A7EE5EF|nr:hypothetical protein [Evtepia sp.]MDY3992512.1 hypothetical protein [Evtepia sp.]MDY4430106.1 hypothetical protein [Evtepia sp.]
MKARLPVLLAALSCVLTLVCLVEIASLKSQLAQVENAVVSNVSHVTSQVGSLSAQIDEAMTRQTSILVSSDWSFGQADLEAYTAPLTFTAVPKEQTPGVTTAALVCGGQTYPMTAGEDGSFSVTLDLPLFEEMTLQRVIFSENGQQRAEALEIADTPFYSCLTIPSTSSMLDCQLEKETMQIEGSLIFDGLSRENGKSLTLVAEVNGEETARVPVPLNFDSYYLTEVPVQAEVSVPAESTLTLYAEVEDANGLRYRSFLDEIDTTGNDAGNALCTPALSIYNSRGSLLWSEEY